MDTLDAAEAPLDKVVKELPPTRYSGAVAANVDEWSGSNNSRAKHLAARELIQMVVQNNAALSKVAHDSQYGLGLPCTVCNVTGAGADAGVDVAAATGLQDAPVRRPPASGASGALPEHR